MGGVRVLVAEDEVATRLLLAGTLRKWGYDVVAVGDGAEALASLREAPAEILVSDWEMPGLDGPTLCERARAEPRDRHVFILLLTHHVDSAAIARGLAAGADDFAPKPFDPLTLRARLEVARRTLLLHDQARAARELLEGVAGRDVVARAHARALGRQRAYGLAHVAGPVSSAELAELRRAARPGDLVVSVDDGALVVADGVSEAEWAPLSEALAAHAGRASIGAPPRFAYHDGASDESLSAVLARASDLESN